LIVNVIGVESNNFLEDADFLIKVGLLFVEDISLVLVILLGSGVLSNEAGLFRSALINVSLVSGDFSFEFHDSLLNLNEISLVDLDFLFELKFEVSSGDVGSNLVFLGLNDLTTDSGFKVIK
jgi:hypothetical protein